LCNNFNRSLVYLPFSILNIVSESVVLHINLLEVASRSNLVGPCCVR